jgi:hypothetical protein
MQYAFQLCWRRRNADRHRILRTIVEEHQPETIGQRARELLQGNLTPEHPDLVLVRRRDNEDVVLQVPSD